MPKFALYSSATGLYSGITHEGRQEDAELTAAVAGAVAMPIVEQPHAKRLANGELIDYQPPQPDLDHEWDDLEKVWRLNASTRLERARKQVAQDQIDQLEQQQARAIREHAIGRGGTPAELKKRLEDIDDQIVALRATLT